MKTINDDKCKCSLTDETNGWDRSNCPLHHQEAPRFFIDHSTVHDRLTGKHVELPDGVHALVSKVLSSAYHRPLPGQPDLATEAYRLAEALCELASDGGASARIGWGVVSKVGPRLRSLTTAVEEFIEAYQDSDADPKGELLPNVMIMRKITMEQL